MERYTVRSAGRRERVTSFGVISLNSIAHLSFCGEIIPLHRWRTAAGRAIGSKASQLAAMGEKHASKSPAGPATPP
jgi:hypothetical protein